MVHLRTKCKSVARVLLCIHFVLFLVLLLKTTIDDNYESTTAMLNFLPRQGITVAERSFIKTQNSALHSRYNTVSGSNITSMQDINGEMVIYNHDNHIIFGNPLLTVQCRNALYSRPSDSTADVRRHLSPSNWILTRERLSKTSINISGKWFLNEVRSSETMTNRNNTARYINIAKSASTSMMKLMRSTNSMEYTIITEGQYHPSACGFSVVRNPISRFVSGYYTTNLLLLQRDFGVWRNEFKFLEIKKEPERFRAYVDEMVEKGYGFVGCPPAFHVASQTQIISVAQIDLQFILRVEHDLQTSYNLIASEYCDGMLSVTDELMRMNKQQSAIGNTSDELYTKPLGIDKIVGVMMPAWYALDRPTWSKLVEWFKQDYICFGYTPDYEREVLDVIRRGSGK